MNKNLDFKWIVDYVKDNFQGQCEEVVEAAAQVVEQTYLFQLEWDMEQTHQPVNFQGDIQWDYCPEDDMEWTFAFNRHRFFITLGQAYHITGDVTYRECFFSQLKHWIMNVDKTEESLKTTWRSIEAGLRLNYWAVAWELCEGHKYASDELTRLYLESIREHCDYIYKKDVPFSLISNWGVLENQGLFIGGLILDDKSYQDKAIERIDNALQVQVLPDGVHWEQSPMYHNEVLRLSLDVMLWAKNYGYELPKSMIDKVRDMSEVNMYWMKPDRHELMQGDSDDFDLTDVLVYSAIMFNDPRYKSLVSTFDFTNAWIHGQQGEKVHQQLGTVPNCWCSVPLVDSGNYYMRTDWGYDGTLIHFSNGPIGGGHGHLEKLHIDLVGLGEDILVDAGRYTYVDKAERYLLKGSLAHNTLRIDNQEFIQMKNEWGYESVATSLNNFHRFTEEIDYVEGGHLGYFDKGIICQRKILFIKPDIVVVADQVYGSNGNDVERIFNYNPKGTVSLVNKHEIRYIGENVIASGYSLNEGELCVEKSLFSPKYNLLQESTRVIERSKSHGLSTYLTVFNIHDNKEVSEFKVERTEVISMGEVSAHDKSKVDGLRINKGDREYLVALCHEDTWSGINLFEMDGIRFKGRTVVIDRTNTNAVKVLKV